MPGISCQVWINKTHVLKLASTFGYDSAKIFYPSNICAYLNVNGLKHYALVRWNHSRLAGTNWTFHSSFSRVVRSRYFPLLISRERGRLQLLIIPIKVKPPYTPPNILYIDSQVQTRSKANVPLDQL